MEEPPDIRKPSRKESVTGLLYSVRQARARRLATSASEFIGKGQWGDAFNEFQEAAETYEEMREPVQQSNMLSLSGLCLYALGKYQEALDVMLKAISLKREAGADEGLATDLIGMGETLFRLGRLDEAKQAFEESIALFEKLGLSDGSEGARRGLEKVQAAVNGAG